MSKTRSSFGRCLLNAEFLDRFYEIFLKSHPSIAPMFRNAGMEKLKEMLLTSLTKMVMYAEGKPGAEAPLTKIGKSHSTHGGHNVDPGLYQYWIDSLVQAVAEIDPEFTPEVESSWRADMKKGVAFVISQY